MLDVSIPIVNRCNLKCPSCIAEISLKNEKSNFISLQLFEKILNKIVEQYAESEINLILYSLCEPLLHPKVIEILDIVQKYDLTCEISSNLNIKKISIETIVAHSTLRRLDVSISGYTQEVYSKGHKGGDINLVLKNLKRLKGVEHSKKVYIKFHKYNDNDVDYIRLQQLAKDYGFKFTPVTAYYMSDPEVYIDISKQKADMASDRAAEVLPRLTNENIVLLQSAKCLKNIPCKFQTNEIYLNCAGDVYTCCMTGYNKRFRICNIFETEAEQVFYMKKKSKICSYCRLHGLHVQKNLQQILYHNYPKTEWKKIKQIWDDFLQNYSRNTESKSVYIYGAGWYSDFLYHLLQDIGIDILGFIDDDPAKKGTKKHGLEINQLTDIPATKLGSTDIILFMIISSDIQTKIIHRVKEYCDKNPYTFFEYLSLYKDGHEKCESELT